MPEEIYFSHDANASNDPKVEQMRSVYGWQGYGWYWAIVENMRTEQNYALKMRGQYVWNAFAMRLQCDSNAAEKFIMDCINEFHLFDSDGEVFWSNSLRRRMEKMQKKTDQAKAASLARWEKHADAMRTHSGCNANAMPEQCNKKKRKERSKDHNNNSHSTSEQKRDALFKPLAPLPPGMTPEEFLAEYENSKNMALSQDEGSDADPADQPPWEQGSSL